MIAKSSSKYGTAATVSENKRNSGILLLIAAGMAQFIVCADWWAAAIALPPMAEDFGVAAVDLQWVITGYIMTFCAVLGVAGPLGDRYGRKLILQIGIFVFALVSLWVGFSQTVTMVIVSRVALGIGGGLLFPLATAVVSEASSPGRLPRNLSILLGVAILGAAVGPVMGGALTHALSWRWIFFCNLPICAVAFVMVQVFAKESRDPNANGRLDYFGILFLLIGIGAISVSIDRIPHWPLYGWLSVGFAGVIALLAFGWLELKIKSPLVNLRLLSNRQFVGFAVGGMAGNIAWSIIVFGSTLLLQQVLHFSALDAGLFFLFISCSTAIASFLGARLERQFGATLLVAVALVLQAIGLIIMFIDDNPIWLAIAMVVAGFGCAWSWSMSQAGAIITMPKEKVGMASGSIMTVVILAGNTAIVIVATIIDVYQREHGGNYAVGIEVSYLIGACAAVVGLVGLLLILGHSMKAGKAIEKTS